MWLFSGDLQQLSVKALILPCFGVDTDGPRGTGVLPALVTPGTEEAMAGCFPSQGSGRVPQTSPLLSGAPAAPPAVGDTWTRRSCRSVSLRVSAVKQSSRCPALHGGAHQPVVPADPLSLPAPSIHPELTEVTQGGAVYVWGDAPLHT